MCGFIRRFSKFGISLSLIVLTLALGQIGGHTDLLSSKTGTKGPGVLEKGYSETSVLARGESIDAELSGNQSYAHKITLGSREYLRALITQSGLEVDMTANTPDGDKLSEFNGRQERRTDRKSVV